MTPVLVTSGTQVGPGNPAMLDTAAQGHPGKLSAPTNVPNPRKRCPRFPR